MTGGLSMGIGMGLSMSDAMGMGMGMPLDLPMHSLPGATAKDTEAEKRRNMSEVLSMLRSRVAGRGVCREAVERLGTLEGFECMWQENNLSIAGNSVDLEIEFGRGGTDADVVKDVTLRYATQDMAEGEKREAASAVLKRVLTFDNDDDDDGGDDHGDAEERVAAGEWKPVDAFHANLTRLARMDGLCREVNCFEAVEGVHESLQKVWDSTGRGTDPKLELKPDTDTDTDTKKPTSGPESRFWERLCRSSSVGCPTMHRGENVGLAIHYWADQRRLLDAQRTSLEEVLQAELSPPSASLSPKRSKGSSRRQVYNAVIECEAGYPSLRISKGWVGDPTVLPTQDENSNENNNENDINITSNDNNNNNNVNSNNNDNEGNNGGEDTNGKVGRTRTNWLEPGPTLVSTDPLLPSSPPNVRFVARLEPAIHVPIVVAAEVYRLVGIAMQQETRPPAAYDALVVPVERRPSRTWKGDGEGGYQEQEQEQENQEQEHQEEEEHVRTVPIFGQTEGAEDEVTRKKHVYSFHALEHVPGYTVRELPFSHPRQIEEVIPLLRQYALLGKLLGVFQLATKSDKGTKGKNEDADEEDRESDDEGYTQEGHHRMDNVDAAETRLDSLLSSTDQRDDETKRISISLRTPVSSPPTLLVVFPLAVSSSSSPSSRTASVTVEVLADGRLQVPCTRGIVEVEVESSSGPADTPTRAAEEKKLCGLLGRVLETCEDLGLLVESACKYAVRRHRSEPR